MIPELEAIKRLLLHEWDPIGVADVPQAADEYDSYAMRIFTVLHQGATVEYIAGYLDWVVIDPMCMSSAPDRSREIAEKAVAIHLSASPM